MSWATHRTRPEAWRPPGSLRPRGTGPTGLVHNPGWRDRGGWLQAGETEEAVLQTGPSQEKIIQFSLMTAYEDVATDLPGDLPGVVRSEDLAKGALEQ
ncbi:hypothetical protein SKAU_G00276930 [Synaphobranchus kaupii]|uniref:Uncharacterized protein n=1 Tax=Synaphobranchus kaupii TaxID=118154 RepID=A0A9Q1F1B6_SYNKA|nr:hypothetical protein SKAU_G00276930 [Synaphobranchus kaupii]